MRRPYYNSWTYAHGDTPPEEPVPPVVFYMVPSKYNNSQPHLHNAVVAQRFEESRSEKRNYYKCTGKKTPFVFIVLFFLFFLAFAITLIAWGVLSNGFKSGRSQEEVTHTLADENSSPGPCKTSNCLQLADNIVKYLDTYANPCDSFYHYACGRHARENEVPPTNEKFGLHEVLIKKVHSELKQLLEAPAYANEAPSTILSKRFYAKCMDLESITKEGITPLKNLIAEYGGWPLLNDGWQKENYTWEITNAKLLSKLGVQTLLSVSVDPDPYNNSRMVITVDQTGGDNNNVFNSDQDETDNNYVLPYFPKRVKRDLFHSAYLESMADLVAAFGADRSHASSDLHDVILFESLILNITISSEDRQNHADDYHLKSINDLRWEIPTINWNVWFLNLLPEELGIDRDDKIFNVVGLTYLKSLENLLADTPTRTIANYHMFNLAQTYIDFVSPVFKKFKRKHSKFVHGIEADLESTIVRFLNFRWEECVIQTVEHLPWPVSALYSKQNGDTSLKDDVEVLVGNLQRAMERKLRRTEWMDDSTIDRALEKLAEMDHRISYPAFIYNDSKIMEEFEDFNLNVLMDKSYFTVVVNLTRREIENSFMRFLNGEIFSNWPYDSPPISVNAFYRFQDNEIVLPIGLLQSPLISSDYPKYVQYSRIGVLSGHEMTHAYDVEGSQYDKLGNLRMWWTNETFQQFKTKTECLIKQYDNITEPTTGRKLHGKRMIGESMSDNLALSMAYEAYKIWLKDNSLKEEKRLLALSKFTTDQIFFLSFANMWCETVRPEALPYFLDTEEHALSVYRVDVPLQNFVQFAHAFNCPSGSVMNPVNKCKIW